MTFGGCRSTNCQYVFPIEIRQEKKQEAILLSSELVLLERIHELRRQTESPQAQTALRATADVVDKRNRPLVQLLLVKVLVLDHVHVDEVAHVGARVPSDIVRIDVYLPQHPDHLILVGNVGLRSRSGRCRVGRGVVKVRFRRHLNDGEREGVGDLQSTINVHTDDRTGRGRRESLRRMLDDLHDHLCAGYQYLLRIREGIFSRAIPARPPGRR